MASVKVQWHRAVRDVAVFKDGDIRMPVSGCPQFSPKRFINAEQNFPPHDRGANVGYRVLNYQMLSDLLATNIDKSVPPSEAGLGLSIRFEVVEVGPPASPVPVHDG
jgi:hypothetical protein